MTNSHRSTRSSGYRSPARHSDADLILWITVALSVVALTWALEWKHFSWVIYLGALMALVIAIVDVLHWLLRSDPLQPLILVWIAVSIGVAVWLAVSGQYLLLLLLLTISPWTAMVVVAGNRLRGWLYRASATRGHARAQYRWAQMLFYGDGVAEDVERALYWYHQAAEQRYRPAEKKLATIYKRGLGVEKDRELADKWYARAQRNSRVVSKLSPE